MQNFSNISIHSNYSSFQLSTICQPHTPQIRRSYFLQYDQKHLSSKRKSQRHPLDELLLQQSSSQLSKPWKFQKSIEPDDYSIQKEETFRLLPVQNFKVQYRVKKVTEQPKLNRKYTTNKLFEQKKLKTQPNNRQRECQLYQPRKYVEIIKNIQLKKLTNIQLSEDIMNNEQLTPW